MKLFRLVSEYRWPIYLGGHLAMSVIACGVLVWVATRPDVPRPIRGYYEAAEAWDVREAVEDASRQLGWTVHFELPDGVPHYPGMPRPVDVSVTDRAGAAVDVADRRGQSLFQIVAIVPLSPVVLLGLPVAVRTFRTLSRPEVIEYFKTPVAEPIRPTPPASS